MHQRKTRNYVEGAINLRRLSPSITANYSAAVCIANNVILSKVGIVLVRLGQSNGPVVQSAMRTTDVVKPLDVFPQQVHQVIVAEHGEVIQALGFDRFHKRLGVAVHFRHLDGAQDHVDVYCIEHCVKSTEKFLLVIADEMRYPDADVLSVHMETRRKKKEKKTQNST